jgi:Tol biopolymer transport system component
VLYAGAESTSDFGISKIAVYTLATGGLQPLTANGTRPRYASTGHLVFGQGGTLMAAPFDGQHMAVTGAPIPIVEGVMQFGSSGVAQYSFSDNGSLAYISGGNQAAQRALVWVDRKGGEQPLALRAGEFGNPRVSPEGRRIAVLDQGQVWIYDIVRETLTRLTFDTSGNLNPTWTIDGKRVVFQAGSPSNMFEQPADGSGKPEQLRTSEFRDAPSSWSPDGQVLAFSETSPATGMDIWTLRSNDQRAQPFLQTRFNEGAPRFSPDGRWLAYVSDESGRWEIYVQPYPGPGGKWQISTDGGREPVWNRNGRELFYRNGDKMMAVDVTADPTFSASKPRMLFEGNYQPAAQALPAYDVSPDGQRFLMTKPVKQAQVATQINVVLNWFEELKQKVPAGGK